MLLSLLWQREGNRKGPTSSSEQEGPKTPDPKVASAHDVPLSSLIKKLFADKKEKRKGSVFGSFLHMKMRFFFFEIPSKKSSKYYFKIYL